MILKNPRTEVSFEDPSIKCSVCFKTNSYFVVLSSDLIVCKGCLCDLIKEIDQEIINDIKMIN